MNRCFVKRQRICWPSTQLHSRHRRLIPTMSSLCGRCLVKPCGASLRPSTRHWWQARAVREKVPVTVYGIPGGSIIDILQSYDLQEGDIGQHLDTFIVHEDGTIRWYSYNPEEEDIEISAHPNGPYLDLMTSEDQIFEPMYVLVAESLGIDYSVPQRTSAL